MTFKTYFVKNSVVFPDLIRQSIEKIKSIEKMKSIEKILEACIKLGDGNIFHIDF